MVSVTLDDRKKKILLAIIKTYLDTGEPVGSRTISKIEGLSLSSATIRNEMADLVDMGYILQPHTSAGRIPSDKGYRFYVDQLMEEKEHQIEEREREADEMKDMLVEKADKMERLLQQVARSLSANTNYAAMISAPRYNLNRLKFIQLSRMEANRIVAVIVVEGNMIKNQIIDIDEPIDDETLLKLNMLLNTTLNGMAIEDINLSIIAKMKQQAGDQAGIIAPVSQKTYRFKAFFHHGSHGQDHHFFSVKDLFRPAGHNGLSEFFKTFKSLPSGIFHGDGTVVIRSEIHHIFQLPGILGRHHHKIGNMAQVRYIKCTLMGLTVRTHKT